jgi:hypothetical protein
MDQGVLLNEVEGQGESMTFRDISGAQLMLAYIFRDFDTAKEMCLRTFPCSQSQTHSLLVPTFARPSQV